MTHEYESDIVTREILQSAVKATVDEMEFVIGRTAMSDGFRDKKDYFIGLFDPNGRMIHGLMSYSGAGMVSPVLQHYPTEVLREGDIYFFNDPYSSGGAVQHTPDSVVVTPLFAGGQLIALAAGFGHVADVGGALRRDANRVTDVFAEGVGYPPMRVGRDSIFDDSFIRMLRCNSRAPDLVVGDLQALHAACRLAEKRLVSLVHRYTSIAFKEMIDWSIERTAKQTRAILDRQIHDGIYEGSEHVDVGSGGATVHLTLRKIAGEVEVDLTGSSDQLRGPWNYLCSLNGLRLLMALHLLVFDESLSMNEGLLTSIDSVRFREGSVVQPIRPAPLLLRSQVKAAVSNCLAQAIAASNGGYMTAPQPSYVVVAFDFGAGKEFVETAGVGLGARPYADGPDVIYAPAQRNYPIETVEPKYGLRVERYFIRPDSGGPGQFRGGAGVVRELRILADCRMSPAISNTGQKSSGVAGGLPGGLGSVTVIHADLSETLLPGNATDVGLVEGDLVRISTPGGGGWGDPLERPFQQILIDLNDHFVTRHHAAEYYGLILRPDSIFDQVASERQRELLRSLR